MNFIFFGSPHSASFLLAWTFLSLQIKEFRNLGFYVSDSVYGCVFFFLSGLHFFHVVVGLVILGILSSFPEAFGRASLSFLCTSQDLYFTVQVLYWHFVEVVWLFIILILYSFSFVFLFYFFGFYTFSLGGLVFILFIIFLFIVMRIPEQWKARSVSFVSWLPNELRCLVLAQLNPYF